MAGRLNPLALPALGAAYFMLGAGSLAPVGLITPMARDLDAAPGSIAYLLTAFALTYAAIAPFLQMLIGHWDRRNLVVLGLVILAAGSLACGAAPTYAAAVAGRMIMAIGCSLIGPMVSAAASSIVSPERQGSAIGVVLLGLNLSSVLGVPLISYLDGVIGWRWVMVILAGAAVAISLMLLAVAPAGSRGVRTSPAAMLAVAGDRALGPGLATTYLQMAGNFASYALAGVYLAMLLRAPQSATPAILLAYGVVSVLGATAATWLTDRLPKPTMVTGCLAFLIAIYALLLVPRLHPGAAAVAIACWAVFGTYLQTPHTARLVALAGERRNLVLAMNAALLQLGIASGAALGGMIFNASGAYWLALASLGLTVLSLGTFVASVRAARSTMAAQPPS